MDWRRMLCFAAMALAVAHSGAARAQSPGDDLPVSLELDLPPAGTRVIGDSIPLNWRFTNHTDETLAFLWEGCCRKNGRLDISTTDGRADSIPPGQALAHMFARAAIMSPGQTQSFESFLGDWARFQASGRYELAGRYVGVLDDQNPQVPRATRLWRGTAQSPPIQVDLLSVSDYLAQRPDRSADHRVRLTLSGPEAIPVQGDAMFSVRITSESPDVVFLPWPNSARLWIVDASGARRQRLPELLGGHPESLRLAPGRPVERFFSLTASDFEGESLGSYRAFVELIRAPGSEETVRVPSNPIDVDWTLDQTDVLQLIETAAAGKQSGARNPDLKLLRVYLLEIGPILGAIDLDALFPEAESAAGTLARKLLLASKLKPFAPDPGLVSIPLEIGDDSSVRLGDPFAAIWGGNEAATTATAARAADRIGRILDVRRHLGWDVEIVSRPEPETRLSFVKAIADGLEPVRGAAGIPLRFLVSDSDTAVASSVHIVPETAPGMPVLAVQRVDGKSLCRLADSPDETPAIPPASTQSSESGPTSGWIQLSVAAAWLADEAAAGRPAIIAADGDCHWQDLRTLLAPIQDSGRRIDLVIQP